MDIDVLVPPESTKKVALSALVIILVDQDDKTGIVLVFNQRPDKEEKQHLGTNCKFQTFYSNFTAAVD